MKKRTRMQTPRKLMGLVLVVTFAHFLGMVGPASATTTVNGTIATQAWSGSPQLNPDWAVFAAQQCQQNVKDGVMEALFNAVPLRGKTIVVTLTGATVGGPAERALDILIRFDACSSPTFQWPRLTTLHWGTGQTSQSFSFQVPSLSTMMAFSNFGQAVQLGYRMSY